jgi:putative transposase
MEAIIAFNVVSYIKGKRSVYSLNIHLVLVTKYRRKVITADVLQRLREIFDASCTLMAMHSQRIQW